MDTKGSAGLRRGVSATMCYKDGSKFKNKMKSGAQSPSKKNNRQFNISGEMENACG